jgi:hypothetical protein
VLLSMASTDTFRMKQSLQMKSNNYELRANKLV